MNQQTYWVMYPDVKEPFFFRVFWQKRKVGKVFVKKGKVPKIKGKVPFLAQGKVPCFCQKKKERFFVFLYFSRKGSLFFYIFRGKVPLFFLFFKERFLVFLYFSRKGSSVRRPEPRKGS